VSATEAEEQRR